MKHIALLGSTGSIGVNALEVVSRLNRPPEKDRFCVWGLSAFQNVPLLKRQIRRFWPAQVVVGGEEAARELKKWVRRQKRSVTVAQGPAALERLASHGRVDVVISSVVGAAGLKPLMAALKQGKTVALANKEALVAAGDLLMETARRHGARLLPVDSEHSAMFQCLNAGRPPYKSIRRLILTASGGAFYRRRGPLHSVTVKEALTHPTWKMGKKITVDCATLTNKGLEAIEAHHLFGVPLEKIHIVIHPQSIVHSLVEFDDGAMLAQLSHPDMRLPIQYALTCPERLPSVVKPLCLEEIRTLEFYPPDFRRFPCLNMALASGRRGGPWPAVFNAANEVAVEAFLAERLSFTGIPRVIEKVLSAFGRHALKTERGNGGQKSAVHSLEGILRADAWARESARKFIK